MNAVHHYICSMLEKELYSKFGDTYIFAYIDYFNKDKSVLNITCEDKKVNEIKAYIDEIYMFKSFSKGVKVWDSFKDRISYLVNDEDLEKMEAVLRIKGYGK